LYSSLSIIRIIKSRMVSWAEHVARIGEKRNMYRLLVRKPEGKRPLGRLLELSEVWFKHKSWKYVSIVWSFMAVTMNNAIFWTMTPCGFCKNRHFGGTYHPHHQGERISELGTMLAVTSNVVPSSLILSTLFMKVIHSSETWVFYESCMASHPRRWHSSYYLK
jgi:hypothetical protein